MLVQKEVELLKGKKTTGAGDAVSNEQGSTLYIAVDGTFVATVKVQGNLGGNWYDLAAVNLSSLEIAEAIEAAGLYSVAGIEACEQIRLNVTARTSGTINAVGRFCY